MSQGVKEECFFWFQRIQGVVGLSGDCCRDADRSNSAKHFGE